MLAARICRSPICGPSVKALAEVHAGSSVPAVMLSPNATNLVALIFGAVATVTPKPHDAVCCFASRTVQLTVNDPTVKADPLGGVQATETGCAPPVTTGSG